MGVDRVRRRTGVTNSLAGACYPFPWTPTWAPRSCQRARSGCVQPLIAYVRKHTAQYWCASFLDDLRDRGRLRPRGGTAAPLDRAAVLAAYASARQRLFLLDYDVRACGSTWAFGWC